jgi:D-3-phosphoglycerate dehydrogenase / 2-oxoglutarate reductase
MTLRILNAEASRVPKRARAELAELGDVIDFDGERKELLARLSDVDVAFIMLKHVFDAEAIARAPKLKYIVTSTTGLNHIDVKAAEARGIKVLSLRGETEFLRDVSATAELTWGLLLCLMRRIHLAHQDVLAGAWERYRFEGFELKGKTLGILGYGRLGRIVAGYGKAFRMRVFVHDVRPVDLESGVVHASVDELLTQSDVVSLHLPLDEGTRGYFDAAKFARMKRSALLINTARGELVDEAAMLASLLSGRLAGAAIDVLDGETSTDAAWLSRHELRQYAESHQNLLITPHMGGCTVDSIEATSGFMVAKLRKALKTDLLS